MQLICLSWFKYFQISLKRITAFSVRKEKVRHVKTAASKKINPAAIKNGCVWLTLKYAANKAKETVNKKVVNADRVVLKMTDFIAVLFVNQSKGFGLDRFGLNLTIIFRHPLDEFRQLTGRNGLNKARLSELTYQPLPTFITPSASVKGISGESGDVV